MIRAHIQHGRFVVLSAVLLGSLALLPASAGAQVATGDIPQGLQTAIQQTVEARGEQFAGFCPDVNQSANPSQYTGQWCAFVLSLTADQAEVTFGPVQTNEIHSATFVRSGNAWTTAGMDGGSPRPPSTGNAGLGEHTSTGDAVLVAAFTLGVLAFAGSRLIRRPSL